MNKIIVTQIAVAATIAAMMAGCSSQQAATQKPTASAMASFNGTNVPPATAAADAAAYFKTHQPGANTTPPPSGAPAQ